MTPSNPSIATGWPCLRNVVLAAALAGCGAGTGKATLRFDETQASTGQALLSEETFAVAETFKVKLIQAYLVGSPDEEGTQRLWRNPSCGDNTNENCDVVSENDYGAVDHLIADYFDFSPGVDVNAALNAQAREISTGTYTGVALEFCTTLEADTLNILFGGTQDGATFEHAYGEASCVVNSDPIAPALKVESGDAIVVNLEYTLADSLRGVPGNSAALHPEQPQCVDAGDNTWCFRRPNFHPSISAAK